ncbi:uncharacterized protein TNIN_258781 [Trichonephila inaurata madagascariensis]|uniref:Uncharacterized protein n=1 Tax=Trichonephila inaurata madagascariensis TaxID=2747483 RepID=A0A8X6J0I1_9ARAC|nr:uncharacterized protein TNIN_258781 [Trichonephila inaurata madagascariensis]
MGVACPHLSDETSYTMVESSVGGSCRCQEEYNSEEDSPKACCNPQVFTSVLLGILACVLMTGGVFLAFHRWDPLWLIVSGVGVILVLIGSILHCCGNEQSVRRHSEGGGKSRPVQNDHPLHGHPIPNNGSLTEQLLPLSNARSVSQLSLNMLPGYFPPVVTAYGIEQHSAVVQNINRLVQQQQQQQPQQQPQSPGSTSPGIVSGAGKSFILLTVPGESTPANIQNLMAAVYQLDGSVAMEPPATDIGLSTPPVNAPVPVTPIPLILKNAEVQTCNIWPTTAPNSIPVASNQVLLNSASTSAGLVPSSDRPSTSTANCTAQTEDLNSPIAINLMDCTSEIPQICDNVQSTTENTTATPSTNIPLPTPPVLVDVSTSSADVAIVPPQSTLVEILPESSTTNSLLDLPSPATDVLVDVGTSPSGVRDIPGTSSDVLIDISESTTAPGPSNSTPGPSTAQLSDVVVNSDVPTASASSSNNAQNLVERSIIQPEAGCSTSAANEPAAEAGSSELSLSISNLSDLDGEVDDEELLGRSSPPPSYDDVAQEGENAIGAFGLAYGTI